MKGIHDNNFWDVNAELLIIKEFSDLYQKDTSKEKEESSKIMWGIYFVTHPESKLYNLPDKFKTIAENHLKNPDFKWDKYSNVIQAYKDCVLTVAERALVMWEEIMSMRDISLKSMYVEAISAKDTKLLLDLDKMLASTAKLFDDYKKVKKDYEEEKTTKKGKKNNSLSDNDDI